MHDENYRVATRHELDSRQELDAHTLNVGSFARSRLNENGRNWGSAPYCRCTTNQSAHQVQTSEQNYNRGINAYPRILHACRTNTTNMSLSVKANK